MTETSADEHEMGLDEEEAGAELRQQLEDLEVRTLSLVETVPLDEHENFVGQECKVLFLTERQAMSLKIQNQMEMFMNVLDLNPRPKLLITLEDSMAFLLNHACPPLEQHWMSLIEELGHVRFCDGYIIAEPQGEKGLQETDERIALFLEKVILELAVETNALIVVGDDTCSLTNALSRICSIYALRTGGKLPFYIMSLCQSELYHHRAKTPGTLESVLRKGSKRWKSVTEKIEQGQQRVRLEKTMGVVTRLRAPRFATHYVVFEGLKRGKGGVVRTSWSGFNQFRKIIVHELSSALPNVSFQTLGFRWHLGQGAPKLSVLAGNSLPVAMIDSRTKQLRGVDLNTAVIKTEEDAYNLIVQGISNVRQKLEAADLVDFYDSSNLAFVHSVISKFREIGKKLDKSYQWRGKSIGQVLKDKKVEKRDSNTEYSEETKHRELETNSLITRAITFILNTKLQDQELLGKLIRECDSASLEKLESALLGAQSFDELKEILEHGAGKDIWPDRIRKVFERLEPMGLVQPKTVWKTVTRRVLPLKEPEEHGKTFEETRDSVLKAFQSVPHDEAWHPWTKVDQRRHIETFIALQHALQSPTTISANIEDLDEIRREASAVAIKDRLPSHNTMEGMLILQMAWDKVDIFTAEAKRHKIIAKACYIALLLVGGSIAVASAVSLNRPDLFSNDSLNTFVMVFGTFGTIIASIVAFINPSARWQLLRAKALEIESEIWLFRTRSGRYHPSSGAYSKSFEDAAATKLRNMVHRLCRSVESNSSVEFGTVAVHLTKLFDGLFSGDSTPSAPWCRHGQHLTVSQQQSSPKAKVHVRQHTKPATVVPKAEPEKLPPTSQSGKIVVPEAVGQASQQSNPTEQQHPSSESDECNRAHNSRHIDLPDDHHSPVCAEEYLRLRVQPMVNYYRGRLPMYSRMRVIIESTIVASGVVTSVLSFYRLGRWALIASAFSTMVSSFGQFQSCNEKLRRYTSTLGELEACVFWWKSLKPVERRSPNNVSDLILEVERVLRNERQAWLAVSVNASLMLEKAESAKELKDPNRNGQPN